MHVEKNKFCCVPHLLPLLPFFPHYSVRSELLGERGNLYGQTKARCTLSLHSSFLTLPSLLSSPQFWYSLPSPLLPPIPPSPTSIYSTHKIVVWSDNGHYTTAWSVSMVHWFCRSVQLVTSLIRLIEITGCGKMSESHTPNLALLRKLVMLNSGLRLSFNITQCSQLDRVWGMGHWYNYSCQ